MKRKSYLAVFVAIAIALQVFWGCNNDTDETGYTVFVIEDIYLITMSSATVKSNLFVDFTKTLSSRGIVWGTSSSIDLQNNTGYSTDVAADGEVHTPVENLSSGTTYWVRGYAIYTDESIFYGDAVEFRTASGVTDIDGNFYESIIINNIEWMAENLKVTHYKNGTPIPNVTNSQEWSNLTTGAYVWHDNNYDDFGTHYGALYNYYAVDNSNGLCPDGWHVPASAEWENMFDYLGTRNEAGGKLKSTRTAPDDDHPRWNSPNEGATDEVYFSALPGGHHNHHGYSMQIGEYAWWWTLEGGVYHSNYFNKIIGGDGSVVDDWWKPSGLSLRCVKD